MPTATASPKIKAPPLTVADLADRFGAMLLSRIRFVPFPGTATETDVLRIHDKERRLCELIDGILVEKPMGFRESLLAGILIQLLNNFCRPRNLGMVAGESGMMRLAPGLVRIPDVSFVSWKQLAIPEAPDEPIPDIYPDLAVEVLSLSNTKKEMNQKLADYFAAGTRLVWFVDPRKRTVAVYSSPKNPIVLTENDTLDGGLVLPGFSLSLSELFGELDPH